MRKSFKIMVRYNQEGFVVPWGCHEFHQDVNGNGFQWSNGKSDLYELVVPAKVDAVPDIGNAVLCFNLTIDGHEGPIERVAEEIVQSPATEVYEWFSKMAQMQHPCLYCFWNNNLLFAICKAE